MCAAPVQDHELKPGDIVGLNNGGEYGFLYAIHRGDKGIERLKALPIEPGYALNPIDKKVINGSDIGQHAGPSFILDLRAIDATHILSRDSKGLAQRHTSTYGSSLFDDVMAGANAVNIGTDTSELHSHTRSSLGRVEDMSVFGASEAAPPLATPPKKPKASIPKTPCEYKIPDITLAEAHRIGLISQTALDMLTVQPEGMEDYKEPTMMSEAVALLTKQERGERARHSKLKVIIKASTELTSVQEGVKSKHWDTVDLTKSNFLKMGIGRRLSEHLRNAVKNADTTFRQEVGVLVNPCISDADRTDLKEKYEGIQYLHQSRVLKCS